MDPITLISIVVLISFFIVESYYSRKKSLNLFDTQDTRANISLGALFGFLSLFFAIFIYQLYEYLYQYRFFTLPFSVWTIALLVLLDDFINYVAHRVLHENRFFWAVHEVHHSSEHFNISTAIRLTIMTSLTIWPFWILGFKPEWVLSVAAFSHLYGAIVHTQAINRLGFLEKILVTPSHHRVHHGKNVRYLDRNYGVIFIFWDKLFNSFAEETEKVEYGILHPERSKNPLRILTNPWVNLFKQVCSTPGLKNKLLTLWNPPGWSHDGSSLTAKEMQRQASLASK
jgi:sterol desaturase/sphingolipid hydroxylase (fatty acid hydroxylase superfamily)